MAAVAPGYYENLKQQGYNPEFVASLELAGETLEQRQGRDQRNLATTVGARPSEFNTTNQGRTSGEMAALLGQHQGWGPDPSGQSSVPAFAPPSATPFNPPDAPQLEKPPTVAPPPMAPDSPAPGTAEISALGGIRSIEERFGSPEIAGSTYHKVTGPDGKVTYTNQPTTVAGILGGPTDEVARATQQGSTLTGGGGSSEVVMGGRSLPGADATRDQIEALPARDQIRWYQRMQGAQSGFDRDIGNKMKEFNLGEATLPWAERVRRIAQKQAALYDYLSNMPQFKNKKANLVDELVDGWKREEPVESKDPVKLAAFVRQAEMLAEEKANKDLQERMMAIMMSSPAVAGGFARNQMYGMGMGMGGTP